MTVGSTVFMSLYKNLVLLGLYEGLKYAEDCTEWSMSSLHLLQVWS